MQRLSLAPLLVLLCPLCLYAQGGNSNTKPSAKPTPDLNGWWTDYGTNTYHVTIRQTGAGVVATYDDPYICDPRDGGAVQSTTDDFTATLGGNQLSGQITVCSWGKGNKQGTGLRKADMKLTVSDDGNTLKGTFHNSVDNTENTLVFRRNCTGNYTVGPGVRPGIGSAIFDHTPDNLVPCEQCSGGWLLIDVHFFSGQRLTSDEPTKVTTYECTYTYEATWRCPTTGEIQKRRTFKKVSGQCESGPPG